MATAEIKKLTEAASHFLPEGGMIAGYADARLIAAAPDLYAALTAIVEHVNSLDMAAALAAHYPVGFANMQDAVTAARAALTLASGTPK